MQPRSLRHYLRQKADSMQRAASGRPDGGAWRETIEARVTAGDLTGVRRLRIRDWEYVSDSGPAFGGWSLCPSSPELLCGVIGTCLVHTYEILAASLGIPLDRIEVSVRAKNNDAALLGLETDDPPLPFDLTASVRLEAEGVPPERIADLHRRVEQTCPLTRFVRTPNELTVVIEQ